MTGHQPLRPTVSLRTALFVPLGKVTLPLSAMRALISRPANAVRSDEEVRVTVNGRNVSLAWSTLQLLVRPGPRLGAAAGALVRVGCSLGELSISIGLLGRVLALPEADEGDSTYEDFRINGMEMAAPATLLRELLDDGQPS